MYSQRTSNHSFYISQLKLTSQDILKKSVVKTIFPYDLWIKYSCKNIMNTYLILSFSVVTIMILLVALILSCFVYYIYLNYKNFRQSTRTNDFATSNSVLERTPNQAVSNKNRHASTVSVSTSRLSSEDFHYIHTEV